MTALAVALAWSAGIAAGYVVGPDLWWVWLAAGVSSFGAAALAGPGAARSAALTFAAALLGVARVTYSVAGTPPDPLAALTGEVTLIGRVADSPSVNERRMTFPLDVLSVIGAATAPDSSATDGARVQVRATSGDVAYGDVVEVRGRLAAPRSRPGFPQAELLARRGIAHVLDAGAVRVREKEGMSGMGALYRLRARLETSLRSALPEPQASLTAGILLGTKVGFPAELRAALAATGTSHIVAVSGFNVVIVAAIVGAVAVKVFGRAWALGPMLLAVWAYIALAGAPPSGVRAALMASFVFIAEAVGRLPDRMTTLSLAAAAMLAWDPTLAFDLGFQLSVAATGGLILFANRIADNLPVLPRVMRASLAPALAAELATLPISLATFHTLPIFGPLANLLVGFVVPLIMLSGVLLALLAPLPGLGDLLAWPTWGLSTYFLTVVRWVGDAPGAVVSTGRLPIGLAVAWYVVLALWAADGSADVRAYLGHRRLNRPCLVFVTLAVLPASAVLTAPPTERLAVSLLDVGGSTLFVRDEAGRSILVGVGAAPAALATSVAQRLGLWERKLSLAIATDASDAGRAVFGETLKKYPADIVLAPLSTEVTPPTPDGAAYTAGLSGRLGTAPGQRVELGEGAWLEVVDVRIHDGAAVVDVRVVSGELAVWLPAPGPMSRRWHDVADAEHGVILRLPGRTAAWLRGAPHVRWLAVVADAPLLTQSELGDVPLIDHRTFGAVDVIFDVSGPGLRTERCSAGRACHIPI